MEEYDNYEINEDMCAKIEEKKEYVDINVIYDEFYEAINHYIYQEPRLECIGASDLLYDDKYDKYYKYYNTYNLTKIFIDTNVVKELSEDVMDIIDYYFNKLHEDDKIQFDYVSYDLVYYRIIMYINKYYV
jgi:hypothetical protein